MTENERTSHQKFRIDVGPVALLGGKEWVTVTFRTSGQQWVPSLADMHRICEALAWCEELKFPQAEGHNGGRQIYKFLIDAYNGWKDGKRFGDLAKKYKIPERKANGEIITTNGANIA